MRGHCGAIAQVIHEKSVGAAGENLGPHSQLGHGGAAPRLPGKRPHRSQDEAAGQKSVKPPIGG